VAADAGARGKKLNKTATTATPSASSEDTEKASPALLDESESTTRAAEVDGVEDGEDYDAEAASQLNSGPEDEAPAKRSASHVRLALIVGVAAVVALTSVGGWLGFQSYRSHHAAAQRQLFLQIGRQCALNLTTIDWQHADQDVQRLLNSATGKFLDQFAQRKQPFIEVVKKAQSKSVGTITEAGLESDSGDQAQVLVAVSIKTSNLGAADQPPREWRMRITVEKAGNDVKVSNVSFVQ
jgi:Mce-associated membrane protein